MKLKNKNLFLCLAALLFSLPAGVFTSFAQTKSDAPAYMDPRLPINERVDDLMKRMTLKEKIGQLNLPCVYVDALGKDIPSKTNACRKFAAGTYTSEIGPGAGFFTLSDQILRKVYNENAVRLLALA